MVKHIIKGELYCSSNSVSSGFLPVQKQNNGEVIRCLDPNGKSKWFWLEINGMNFTPVLISMFILR